MHTLKDLSAWMHVLCDDMDPLRILPRPEIVHAPLSSYRGRKGQGGLISIGSIRGGVWNVVAHECRHWHQIQTGRLQVPEPALLAFLAQGFGEYVRTWDGETLNFAPATQAEYEAMPWEKDANEYASDACARLQDWFEREMGLQYRWFFPVLVTWRRLINCLSFSGRLIPPARPQNQDRQ